MNNPYESPQTYSNAIRESWVHMADVATTAELVEHYFVSEGYLLEAGVPTNGIYGIGNNTLRILFGAFVKRYKFHVAVTSEGEASRVVVNKGMSGAMGGAIGYARMKKELARIRAGLQAFLGDSFQQDRMNSD